MKKDTKHTYVKEPLLHMSAKEVRAYFADKHTEKDLANAFAIADNNFWCAADDECDYEENTQECAEATAVTDEWCELMKEYRRRIFEILSAEGVVIPERGYIQVLEPFMARNGYIKGTGWWIKVRND